MWKCLVLGIYAECVAEHTCISELVLDAVCYLIAFGSNYLKRIDSLKLTLVVFVAINYKLNAEILSKTVGCKLYCCLICIAVHCVVSIECI